LSSAHRVRVASVTACLPNVFARECRAGRDTMRSMLGTRRKSALLRSGEEDVVLSLFDNSEP